MIDIFYKSYRNDFKLLKYSLMSVKKFVTGYNELIITIPIKDFALFWNTFKLADLPKRTRVVSVPEYGNGYLYQQVCKLKAHQHSTANYILFTDSDFIFNKPLNVPDLINNGKPEILYTEYEKSGAMVWKEPTERFIGLPVKYEFMRRLQLVYHRSTLEKINEVFPNLEYSVMTSKTFSEFNFIGAWAFNNEPDKYMFTNTDTWEYKEPIGIQLWSWADKNNRSEAHKREYKKQLDTINKVFELNITSI
ncbi:MAG: hypothetical protein V4608_10995 [Bacteroidota bacterium]